MPISSFFKYWGKAEKQDCQSLPYHCMDVVVVADQWWEHSPNIRRSLCQETGLPEEQTYAWIMFYIASYDHGKFDVRFQMKSLDLAKENYKANLPEDIGDKSYFHGDKG